MIVCSFILVSTLYELKNEFEKLDDTIATPVLLQENSLLCFAGCLNSCAALSFTACGKMAQTLEELVTKSDGWLNCCSMNTTPSISLEPEGNSAHSPIPAPEFPSVSRIKQQGSTQKKHGHEINEKTQRSEETCYQEVTDLCC